MADLFLLHRLDHLVRHAEDGIAGKSHHDRSCPSVSAAKPGSCKGLLDHRREIAAGDVGHARPAHEARREDPILIGRSAGCWMQLVVIRIAPGNSANSFAWFCQAVP